MLFKPSRRCGADFPEGFRIQHIGVADAINAADLPPDQLAGFFRVNPSVAARLMAESYDKRYRPSTFMTEEGAGYLVGWLSSDGYEPAADLYRLGRRGRGLLVVLARQGTMVTATSQALKGVAQTSRVEV